MQRHTILALDVGEKRIGVAAADAEVRFAHPLTTLEYSDKLWRELAAIVKDQSVNLLVVGLPRGLQGQSTAQTARVEAFMEQLETEFGLPIQAQDEALTSVKAEAELNARRKPYAKGDIDALAATYILEDYLSERGANT